ncbi:hypothetical protein Gpo141_00009595 [Globisporangium polare]
MRGGQLTPGAKSGSRFYDDDDDSSNDRGHHPQFQARTPVVSVYNNSYNISTLGNSSSYGDNNNPAGYALAPTGSAWTADEHRRFLDGLERHGGSVGGNQNQALASAQNAWRSITAAVRTRSLQEVKMHANKYFLELQLVNSQKRKEHLMMQTIDARWTLEEDALFEHLLASHASRSDVVCYPWEQIAAKIPNKTARDVQERYHKLCYDVARIEAGHHVMMSFGRFSRSSKASNSGGDGAVHPVSSYSIAAAMDYQQQQDSSSRHHDPGDLAQGPFDCVVTLTAEEEGILMKALEQVRMPPHAPPQVLTSIASAMAAIVNSKNKKPPQRSQTLFTLEQARGVFDQLINNQNGRQQQQQQCLEPRAVLEELVARLRLQPRDQNPHPGRGSAMGQKLKPLATAGLAFTDDDDGGLLTPRRYQSSVHFADAKSDISQRGAVAGDLLSFRAASSRHGGGGGGAPSSSSLYSPAGMSSRQTLFSPSNHSHAFSSMPPPSPYSHHFSSPYTPRDVRDSSSGDHDDGAGARDRDRKSERTAPQSSSSAAKTFQNELEDY